MKVLFHNDITLVYAKEWEGIISVIREKTTIVSMIEVIIYVFFICFDI